MVVSSVSYLLFNVRVTVGEEEESEELYRQCHGIYRAVSKFEYSVYCVSVLCNLCCTVSVSVQVWSRICVQLYSMHSSDVCSAVQVMSTGYYSYLHDIYINYYIFGGKLLYLLLLCRVIFIFLYNVY